MNYKLPATTVNYHFTRKCNMRCKYCFATFNDCMCNEDRLNAKEQFKLVEMLAEAGMKKLTITGGEPLLHVEEVKGLLDFTKKLGLVTSLGTNGSLLTDELVTEFSKSLDIIALSIDSPNEQTMENLGRTVCGEPLPQELYENLCFRIKAADIRLKINTVVTKYNCNEDLSNLLLSLEPERWKVLQAIKVDGQNDSRIDRLLVNSEEFKSFVVRHQHLASKGICIVSEPEETIRGSYIMISPSGCFFDSTSGKHTYSSPILDVGVEEAFDSIEFSYEKFIARGGDYNDPVLHRKEA